MSSDQKTVRKLFYLKRISQNGDNQYRIIPFKNDEVYIGRSTDGYTIADIIISRRHALFKRINESSWTITNLSNSGCSLNGTPLPINTPTDISVNSTVQFCLKPDKYVYKFNCKEILCQENRGSASANNPSVSTAVPETDEGEPKSKRPNNTNQASTLSLLKNEHNMLAQAMQRNEEMYNKDLQEKENQLKIITEQKQILEQRYLEDKEMLLNQIEMEKEKQRTLADNEEILAKDLQEKVEALLQNLAEKTSSLEESLRKEEEQRLIVERDSINKKAQLEEERKKYGAELERIRAEVQVDRERMQGDLQGVQDQLEHEKRMNSSLSAELSENKHESDERIRELEKKKQDLELKLNEAQQEKDKLVEVQERLAQVENEKKTMQQEMEMMEFAVTAEAKKSIIDDVSEAMDTDMQCPICNELFIKAVTLNCQHTFCEYCINCWKKNKRDCPSCRTKITYESRVLAIDNFISNMAGKLSEEHKKNRESVIKEREDEVKKAVAAEEAKKAAAAAASAQRRGRGGRSNASRVAGVPGGVPGAATAGSTLQQVLDALRDPRRRLIIPNSLLQPGQVFHITTPQAINLHGYPPNYHEGRIQNDHFTRRGQQNAGVGRGQQNNLFAYAEQHVPRNNPPQHGNRNSSRRRGGHYSNIRGG